MVRARGDGDSTQGVRRGVGHHAEGDDAAPRIPRAALPVEEYDGVPARDKVFKSLKMWTLYVDLEESLGDLTSAKKAYDAMIALRVATPQIVLNYAHLLKEHNYFEDCFQIYERGVNAFKFPYSRDIWLAYLATFVDRFKGTKLERARDLHEQVLTAEAPAKEAKQFYLAYATLEERFGLGKRAMDVYERATTHLPADQRLEVYDAYVAKAMEFFGVDKVRAVFVAPPTTRSLPRDAAKTLTTRFAEFERKLGELDRARALYAHASQFANPLVDVDFWSTWHPTARHGSEDTFREMLRVKRAVAASFSDVHFNTTEVAPKTEANATTDAPTVADGPVDARDAMARLDAAHEARAATATAAAVPGFVRSHVEGATTGGEAGATGGGDDAEIDLGDDAFAERPDTDERLGGTTATSE